MPNTISLNSGTLTIDVNLDGNHTHTLVINPHDVTFLERGHQIYQDALAKSEELKLAQANFSPPELDDNGVPISIDESSKVIRETNDWFRAQIDTWLGTGTAHAIFGNAIYADEKVGIYAQLISGIMDYVKPERANKIDQFIAPPKKARKRK